MQITVLGCRAGVPAQGQPSSGYLVDTGDSRILLDCGPGIATSLSAVMDPADLDAVVISHTHIDHVYDLLPLGKALLAPVALSGFPGVESLFGPGPHEMPRVPLYLPAGSGPLLERWSALLSTTTLPLLDRVFDGAFEVHEYEPDDITAVGVSTLEFVELRHAKPNCGVRICAPSGSLAYTGDTGPTEALVRLAADIDLFVSEATLAVSDPGAHGHLCAADAARAAAAARAGQLLLTHFPTTDEDWLKARLTEAAAEFAGPIHLARPSAVFQVGEPVVAALR
ncbi:MBL fold metallo-hydrolase [Nocardia sp. alder85J]|uniref:MBL fold metallo-hydrolase n=1 Tax=Nocardia sp. alder85J TaxID=2862949 RepID=UPI001CD2D037|nr:MBL fold metallo-hydrolase [Nocardia sp. alder85J]MCX4091541.1 MBL fold metallo-hydrolase [Nocardia sp. alder85J]